MKILVQSFLCLGCVGLAMIASAEEVGSFRLGTRGLNFLSSNYLKVLRFQDPQVAGATCFVSTITAKGLTLSSDPSDTSVACRQTGPISTLQLQKLNQSEEGEVVFSLDKGGFNKSFSNMFKELNIRRFVDLETKTLIYISYTTKAFEGHYKNAISVITLR